MKEGTRLKKKDNEIRTPRSSVKIGERVMHGDRPVALIRQGGKADTISLEEFAEMLYGKGIQCMVFAPSCVQQN